MKFEVEREREVRARVLFQQQNLASKNYQRLLCGGRRCFCFSGSGGWFSGNSVGGLIGVSHTKSMGKNLELSPKKFRRRSKPRGGGHSRHFHFELTSVLNFPVITLDSGERAPNFHLQILRIWQRVRMQPLVVLFNRRDLFF